MTSAPRAFAVALLLLHLVLLGQAHGQQLPASPTSSMPSPVLMPDPGARCSGWLPCPTIDPWAITAIINPWYSAPAVDRSEAAGVRASLVLDVARYFEGGISAALLTWETLNQPPARVMGWNILGAHVRGRLPLGALSLVGSYAHEWSLSGAGYGLLPAGQTAGRGSLAAHLPLFSSLVTVGAVAGIAYNPSGAAAAEVGLRVALVPPDQDHHVVFWLEGQFRRGVHGDAGGPAAWAGLGFSSLSVDPGTELGGGILIGRGDGVPALLFAFKLAEHFGLGYRPPSFLIRQEDPDELVTALAKPHKPQGTLPPLLPRPQIALAGPPALQRPLGPQLAPGLAAPGPGAPGPAAPGPALPGGPLAWYPQAQPEPASAAPTPAPPPPGSVLSTLLHPPRLPLGQSRPPERPLSAAPPTAAAVPPPAQAVSSAPPPRPSPPAPAAQPRCDYCRPDPLGPVAPAEAPGYGAGCAVANYLDCGERPSLTSVGKILGPLLSAVRPRRSAAQPPAQPSAPPPAAHPQPASAAASSSPSAAAPAARPQPAPAAAASSSPPASPPARPPWSLSPDPPPPQRPPPPPRWTLQTPPPRSGGKAPVQQGRVAVEKEVRSLNGEGRHVIGTEVTLQAPSGRRRADILVREKDGSLTQVEVKAGPHAQYPTRQRMLDGELERDGAVPVGENARKAGLTETPVKVKTEVRRR